MGSTSTARHDTHERTTDPDSRLSRKSEGKERNLCYMGHATRENRNGLAVAGLVTQASGTAERAASFFSGELTGFLAVRYGEDQNSGH